MAQNTSGKPLSAEEVNEYVAYANRGVAAPDKYDGVVFENSTALGANYRYATADEVKASQSAAQAAQKAADEAAAVNARIDADVVKRRATATPAAPARPDGA